ncbi:MAG: CHAT domain-containing protein [Synechococcales cyanobacterium K44_A2020_017]|nr:CHAT domain-containing protein [Synechococcales cyanobacterium K32_A2020_035]MBF2095802.1 CHAT domain-containing protein [Synechococcales cyanobacterium K44_A2020_017]
MQIESDSQKKILIFAANPIDTPPLRLDEEVREIESVLRKSKKRDSFSLSHKWAVRPRDLQQAMLEVEPEIVHFCGHGMNEKGLVFENSSGRSQLVDGDALADLFRQFEEKLECVILSGCYSSKQAESIAKHISYVIGMNHQVEDVSAIEFSVGFYGAIGAGRDIQTSYELGCNALKLANIMDPEVPILKRKIDLISFVSENKSKKSKVIRNENIPITGKEVCKTNILSNVKVQTIRNQFRIPLTYLAATYHNLKLKSDGTKQSLFEEHKISVLSKSDFLPIEPMDLTKLDNFLCWADKSNGLSENPDEYCFREEGLFKPAWCDIASILKSNPDSKLYNGFLYRVLEISSQKFLFSPGRYYDFLNTCEYLSYELASAIADNQFIYDVVAEHREQDFCKVANLLLENENLLPMRSLSHPFDFASRCTAFGTCALVVIKRSRKEPQFILNMRSNKLSETPGLKHIIPAGTFQPNFQDDRFHEQEFSFVENIIREFTEELLDDENLRGDSSSTLRFTDMYGERGKAFRREVVEDRNVELLYLGMVIDPINLKPEILTVLMIHEAYLRGICGKRFQESWETQDSTLDYNKFSKLDLQRALNKPLVPTGKAHLWLTLKHFDFLYSRLSQL